MRIALISDQHAYGGAAIAAGRLAVGLRRRGHDVHRLVATGETDGSAVIAIRPPRTARGALRRLPTSTRADLMVRPLVRDRLTRVLSDLDPDLVSVHNLHDAFRLGWSAELVTVADEVAPTLWTLHDMWSFTGRCAYSYDCQRFLSGCDHTCPTPRDSPALVPSRIAGEYEDRRRRLAALHRTTAVAPSRWLAETAAMGLWGDRVRHVPYGLPLDVYAPSDPGAARRELGIPEDRPVLLASAVQLTDERKGADLLMQALARLSRPVTLVTVGSGQASTTATDVRVVALGSVNDTERQAKVYAAADLLVHPARADNLPLVVQEAIACGTPVVAFPVGGLPDMVVPGVTGWLAEPGPAGLAAAVEEALGDSTDLRASCREHAVGHWDLLTQADRYLELWESLR